MQGQISIYESWILTGQSEPNANRALLAKSDRNRKDSFEPCPSQVSL